jgi:hypothetical protein
MKIHHLCGIYPVTCLALLMLGSCAQQHSQGTFSKTTVKRSAAEQSKNDNSESHLDELTQVSSDYDSSGASGAHASDSSGNTIPAPLSNGSAASSSEGAATAGVPPVSTAVVTQPPANGAVTDGAVTPGTTLPPIPNGSVESIEKVGINFEDSDGGDNDYNDSVLCFKGKLVVDPVAQTVKSRVDQVVTALYTRRADCNNQIAVDVLHADGTREPRKNLSVSNGGTTTVSLKFKAGSRLEVYLIAGTPCSKSYLGEVDMHSANDALVKVDICNTTGN